MIKKVVRIGLTIAVLGFVTVAAARADETDKKTVLTFNQPVEIPGRILPAGTYTFTLFDALGDRHVVQIFNADGTKLITTVLTVPDYRLEATDKTALRFFETPSSSPQALRAWFYPGNTLGQEFVYPKARAAQLASASRIAVPALGADAPAVDDLKTVAIVAVTPDAKETTVAAAIQTTPLSSASPTLSARADGSARTLPKTAGALPTIALFGLMSLVAGFGLMVFRKRAAAAAAL
jgi:hypothetical protein